MGSLVLGMCTGKEPTMRNAMAVLALVALAVGAAGCGQIGLGGAAEVIYRVNAAGEKDYVDENGALWKADQVWEGKNTWGAVDGTTVHRFNLDPIQGTPAPDVYLDERYSMDGYCFKVPNGTYSLRLHFAETYEGITAEGERVFTVKVEGEPVLKDLDVFKEAGGFAKPLVKTVPDVKVSDGRLDIEFVPNVQNPEINGIEVLKP